MNIADYETQIVQTDRFRDTDISPILFGLFGEIGSVMAAAKKFRREGNALLGYRDSLEEEFGDVLWYFAALCRRLGISPSEVVSEGAHSRAQEGSNSGLNDESTLLELGQATAQLLRYPTDLRSLQDSIRCVAINYRRALAAFGIDLDVVARKNAQKTIGRFVRANPAALPTFDQVFEEEEQLPWTFEIEFKQRKSGKCYLRWNGVFIGAPLTDNISDPDGYRFHDVFHIGYAAVLHWSPTFRSLIQQKRKSDPAVDENQDGGRAIVIEEGLAAWIFSCAKQLNYFDGATSVSFDVLKTVRQFVAGYEVDQCPLSLWEDAILQGYSAFRELKRHNGGIIIGDRGARSIRYRSM